MPKFREMVRRGDQVGVPESYRASLDAPVKSERKKMEFRDPELRASRILRYIREHKGERMTGRDLSEVAGYTTAVGANKLMSRLITDNRMRRIKRGYAKGWTYVAVDGQNGPVKVIPGDKPVETGYEKLAREIVKETPNDQSKIRTQAEKAFLQQLDIFIWDYLGSISKGMDPDLEKRVGFHAQAFVLFRNYLQGKISTQEDTDATKKEDETN